MRFVAGCDVGSLTTKAVIMEDGRIRASAIIKSRPVPADSASAVIEDVLRAAALKLDKIAFTVGTGYGRDKIPFADKAVSEIQCHARAARWFVPGARTVIDIGGQDAKEILMDPDGSILQFVTNDKCAAGTGRFLEVMAKVLGVSLTELGAMSRRARAPVVLASTCTVWAQADVIQYIHSGKDPADIGAGIDSAMAKRVATLAGSVKPAPEICLTGGVAKNQGVAMVLERLLGMKVAPFRKADPQLAGAIGAALLAREAVSGSRQAGI